MIVVAIGAMALLPWRLVDVPLLVFGAVLVPVLLCVLAAPITRRTPLSNGWALPQRGWRCWPSSVVVWLFGSAVRTQIAELIERLPQAWRLFEERLGLTTLGQRLVNRAEDVAPAAGSVDFPGILGRARSYRSPLNRSCGSA